MTRAKNAAASDAAQEPLAEPDAAGAGEGDVETNDGSVSPLAPPADAEGWRALVAALPARELLRFLQKDKVYVAKIFAGFRPDVNTVRRSLVVNRIVDEAIKSPKFAKAFAEAAFPFLTPLVSDDSAIEATANADASLFVAPTVPSVATIGAGEADKPTTVTTERAESKMARPSAPDDERLRQRVQEQRAALRERDERIRSLTAALADAGRERDAARAEAQKSETERQAAVLRAETEKRRAERDLRRQEKQENAAPAAARRNAPLASASPAAIAGTLTPAFNVVIFLEALRRLLTRGKHVIVAEVCREVLGQPSGDARTRGNVSVLLALALYRQGRDENGAEQDRQAAAYFLSAGRLGDAADALARAIAANASSAPALKSGKLSTEANDLLGKLLILADRTGATEAVRQSLSRLRLTSPDGFAQLGQTLQKGDKRRKEFYETLTPATTARVLGPDDLVALPSLTGEASTVTPRRLAAMVEGNDVRQVGRVRQALAVLRQSGADGAILADALLTACARILPAALFPFAVLSPPRPVVVDASNVARYDPDPLAHLDPKARGAQTGRLRYLLLMRDHLLRKGFFPVLLIADATLRFMIDDKAAYLALVDKHGILETPPNTSADFRLIAEAREQGALLITNDRLADWGEAAHDIERLGFGIFGDAVSLSRN